MKILIDKYIPFLNGVLEAYADISYKAPEQINKDTVQDADALIIRTRTKINKELLHSSKVRFIASATIGTDHIDKRYCTDNLIHWENASGCNSQSVNEYVTQIILQWMNSKKKEAKDLHAGIIGVGNVGKKLKNTLETLGMKVSTCDPPRAEQEADFEHSSMEEIFHNCHIISFHVPLSYTGPNATHHMLNHQLLQYTQDRDCLLINTSRGEVLEGKLLLEQCEKYKSFDIALDVWENEPNISQQLLKKCFFASPHIAGYSADGKAKGSEMSVQALARFYQLPLTNWTVTKIPQHSNRHIFIPNDTMKHEESIAYAMQKTYNIWNDCEALNAQANRFEQIRAHYPIRREFKHFCVELEKTDTVLMQKLVNVGFKSFKK